MKLTMKKWKNRWNVLTKYGVNCLLRRHCHRVMVDRDGQGRNFLVNLLFDDGLFYTFYALAFREKKIKMKYKTILDSLRTALASMIEQCNNKNLIKVADPQNTADLIFVLVDGAYFYLSLESNKKVYIERLSYYKNIAYQVLGLNPLVLGRSISAS